MNYELLILIDLLLMLTVLSVFFLADRQLHTCIFRQATVTLTFVWIIVFALYESLNGANTLRQDFFNKDTALGNAAIAAYPTKTPSCIQKLRRQGCAVRRFTLPFLIIFGFITRPYHPHDPQTQRQE